MNERAELSAWKARLAGVVGMSEFTLKQRRFIEAYIGEARGNATEAATIAGYKDPEQAGYENKRKQEIRAAINAMLADRTLSSHEVLERLTQHANGTLSHFIDLSGDEAKLNLSSETAKPHLHLLKKIKTKRRTGGSMESLWEEIETEIELHDPQSALVHLGRYHALFTDRTEGSMNFNGVIGYDITPPDSDRPGDDHATEEGGLPPA